MYVAFCYRIEVLYHIVVKSWTREIHFVACYRCGTKLPQLPVELFNLASSATVRGSFFCMLPGTVYTRPTEHMGQYTATNTIIMHVVRHMITLIDTIVHNMIHALNERDNNNDSVPLVSEFKWYILCYEYDFLF